MVRREKLERKAGRERLDTDGLELEPLSLLESKMTAEPRDPSRKDLREV